MIDHATFQVLDDSVPACSGSHFPGPIIALDVLPHEGDIVMNQNISLHSRKTALPDTWTAPVARPGALGPLPMAYVGLDTDWVVC